ncbi:hypothetical protein [Paraburkholderia solisilvae]|uniref:Lipoprotein n=1 Tax=Paraburkholderia solisilvae TaxID=624376 RepID=A0A6J5DR16_9BURK|nr:hypothetical protein [Paraburkholderia solisilvae]CAB3755721.1 hypothetical protein LMG29739_02265 [Paraburkholderia solisilvae]
MHKVALFTVAVSVLLSGCNRHTDDARNCVAGNTQSMNVAQAMAVLKAAGYEVRQAGDAPAPTAQTAVPPQIAVAPPIPPQIAPAPQTEAPAQTSARRQFSLVCNTTLQGQRVSQNLSVDLDADTVNGTKAQVSDAEIKWKTDAHDQNGTAFSGEVHTLNRLTGDYRFYDESALYSSVPVWQCAPAATRLF